MNKMILVVLAVLLVFFSASCTNAPTPSDSNFESETVTSKAEAEVEPEGEDMSTVIIEIGNASFTAYLYNNTSTQAFMELLPLCL